MRPRAVRRRGRRGQIEIAPALAGAPGATGLGSRTVGGRRRRLSRLLANTLIVLGVLCLLDVVVTMLWQEPLTAIYATIEQGELHGNLKQLESRIPSEALTAQLALARDAHKRIALLAAQLEASAKSGSAVGEIDIPRIKASYALVKGTGTEELEEGPGIYWHGEYPQSHFPGAAGLTAIAGHRTTFLAPFRHVEELRPGDPIVITMPYARFLYKVARTKIVVPEDVAAVMHPGRGVALVLSSCNPPFSAAQRILIEATLASVTPRGPARSFVESLITRSAPSSALGRSIGLPSATLTGRI
jgi:sortase A